MSNPTIDEVMDQVLGAIKAACAPTQIDDAAVAAFLMKYRQRFDARLQIAVWEDEKTNVLNAARQHGLIAASIAALRRSTRLDQGMFMDAAAIVEKHCRLGFQEGAWCGE